MIGVIGVIGRLFVWDWSVIGRIGEIGRQRAFSIGLPNAATINARACNDGPVAVKKKRWFIAFSSMPFSSACAT